MTGESIPTKENWNRLKPYYKKLTATCMILVGSFLIIEHIWTFGQIDLMDWIGHEFYGIGLIIIAFLLMTNWGQWKELKLWIFKNQFR